MVQEKITAIGNLEKFLIETAKNTKALSDLFEKGYCGEAVSDVFKAAMDRYLFWIIENTESLTYGETDQIRTQLSELEELDEEVIQLREDVYNLEKQILFKVDSLQERIWVEEKQKEFNQLFNKKQ